MILWVALDWILWSGFVFNSVHVNSTLKRSVKAVLAQLLRISLVHIYVCPYICSHKHEYVLYLGVTC